MIDCIGLREVRTRGRRDNAFGNNCPIMEKTSSVVGEEIMARDQIRRLTFSSAEFWGLVLCC